MKRPLFAVLAGLAVTVQAADVYTPGFLKREIWPGATRAQVLDGTAGDPATVGAITSFETTSMGDDYTQRISGFFTPDTTGDYAFFIAADDDADLFLSTDEDPANKKLIAQEAGWSNFRNYFTIGGEPSVTTDKGSDTFSASEWQPANFITLQAGQRYYIEAVHHEGGGGDHLSVTIHDMFVYPTEGNPPETAGGELGFNAAPATITINAQPQTQEIIEGTLTTLSVDATTDSIYGIASYQWKKDGVDIEGATSASFTTPILQVADSGASYTVEIRAAGAPDTTSQAAVINVVADTVPPEAVSAVSIYNEDADTTEIGVLFDESLSAGSAETTANYTLSAGTVTGARHVPNSSGVTSLQDGVVLTVTGLPASGATLTVRNVADAKGNAIPAAGQMLPVGSTPLKWITIGRDGADADGVPFEPAAIPVSEDGVNLVSGGASYWATSDDFTFAYQEVTGDFDKKARVEYADASSQWSRNGMTVRASLNNGTETTDAAGANPASIYQNAHVNPPIMFNGSASNFGYEGNRRILTGGQTDGAPNNEGAMTPAFPNAWVRIKRVDQWVTIYRSSDGVEWEPYGLTEFGVEGVSDPLPDTTFVGVFNAPENGNIVGLDPTATTEWANRIRDFGDTVETQKAAGEQTYSIGLNLGANEAGAQLAATDVAGADGVAQANWNNLFYANSTNTVSGIVADDGSATSMTVDFTSNGTWESTGRGEENNNFPVPDAALMTGYLDTGDETTTMVTLSGIPSNLTSSGYDVVLYYLGGVAGQRGGGYRITDASGTVLADYVHGLGVDPTPASDYVLNDAAPGSTEFVRGNVIVFRNLTAPSIVVEATTVGTHGSPEGGTQRAALNAIQLVAPTGVDVIGGGTVDTPTISIDASGQITFEGVLQASGTVDGTFEDVPGATNPYTPPAGETMQFFRSRSPAP